MYKEIPDADHYPKIKLGSTKVDLRDLLIIDPENLVHDYQTIHHWIAVFSHQIGILTISISNAKKDLMRLNARLGISLRSSMTKKMTEKTVESHITLDESYIAAQANIDALEFRKHSLQVALTACENKRDMVINMGAELRKRRSAI